MKNEKMFHERSLLVQSLKIASNLDRKKSLSTSIIPSQNRNYLCVPLLHNGLHPQKVLEEPKSIEYEAILVHSHIQKTSTYQAISRSLSQSTITIPENYSFTSVQIQLYRRRWVLLALGMLSIAISQVQWIQYSIVSNVIQKYYGVPSAWVDWTSMVFMVVYIVCVFPITYIMDVRNLRQTAVIGSVGTAIGAWIKVFSVGRNQFQMVMLGQTVTAFSQVFLMSIPSRLASSWFSPDEASSVCAFGVFAGQLGIAIGFFFAPIVIRSSEDFAEVGVNLKIFLMAVAGISTMIACMVIAVFKSAPQFAPSHVQALQRTMKPRMRDYWPSVIRLMQNDNYLILVVAYGINCGIFNAFSTLLNQIVLNYFPNGEADAGRIGLALILLGLLGSMVFGYLLDSMHKYKATAIWACRLSALTLFIFSLALETRSKKLVSVASVFLGFFMTGFQPIGYEFAAELTFPEPDGPVSGIMNISTQVFGIVITLFISGIQQMVGDLFGNIIFAAFLIIDANVITLIKSELRRLNTHRQIENHAAQEHADEAITHFDDDGAQEDAPLTLRIDSRNGGGSR